MTKPTEPELTEPTFTEKLQGMLAESQAENLCFREFIEVAKAIRKACPPSAKMVLGALWSAMDGYEEAKKKVCKPTTDEYFKELYRDKSLEGKAKIADAVIALYKTCGCGKRKNYKCTPHKKIEKELEKINGRTK